MWLIDQLSEARIAEAMARGEFDDLPGAGRPLRLDDDALVPPELRAAYRVLKNAGYLPPEMHRRKEIASVEALLARVQDAGERERAVRRLNLLRARLALARRGGGDVTLQHDYYEQVLDRLNRG